MDPNNSLDINTKEDKQMSSKSNLIVDNKENSRYDFAFIEGNINYDDLKYYKDTIYTPLFETKLLLKKQSGNDIFE